MSDIETIETEVLDAIEAAGDLKTLDAIRVSELGKKGRVSGLMKTLGQMDPDAAKVITQARTVLLEWEAAYLRVRLRIEKDEGDHRWEFDRKRLFDVTSYMAKVCTHLLEVATVLDQFGKFLGPELKAVTGDSDGIDVMAVPSYPI